MTVQEVKEMITKSTEFIGNCKPEERQALTTSIITLYMTALYEYLGATYKEKPAELKDCEQISV